MNMLSGNRLQFCSGARLFSGGIWAQRGQMTVELAVTIPVLLAAVGIAINLMVFLGDCARFDRLAAEAVRVEAASPGYGSYGITARAQAAQTLLAQSFAEQQYLSISVEATAGSTGDESMQGAQSWQGTDGSQSTRGSQGTDGATFSLLPHQETFVCTLRYRPWGFGDSFFGIKFSGIEHTRSYVIDPFRPGVLL